MKLLVKYCGGCNVYYDRPGLVAQIAACFPDLDITYTGDSGDFAVVLCGCPCACLAHDHIQGRLGKQVVWSAEQGTQLMDRMAQLVGQNNSP